MWEHIRVKNRTLNTKRKLTKISTKLHKVLAVKRGGTSTFSEWYSVPSLNIHRTSTVSELCNFIGIEILCTAVGWDASLTRIESECGAHTKRNAPSTAANCTHCTRAWFYLRGRFLITVLIKFRLFLHPHANNPSVYVVACLIMPFFGSPHTECHSLTLSVSNTDGLHNHLDRFNGSGQQHDASTVLFHASFASTRSNVISLERYLSLFADCADLVKFLKCCFLLCWSDAV